MTFIREASGYRGFFNGTCESITGSADLCDGDDATAGFDGTTC